MACHYACLMKILYIRPFQDGGHVLPSPYHEIIKKTIQGDFKSNFESLAQTSSI